MCVTRLPLSRIKVVAVLILALVCVNVSLAEKVDADAAHRLASEFFSGPASRSVGKLSLAYTCPEDAAYYVFNAEAADGGFVVVAGDDVVTPILGYSDVGTFDPSNIPPALQWKLDTYKAEIATAASKGIKVVASRSASPDKAPIDPLITTQWGQGEPYNNLTPIYGGEHSATGCVATALAQILYFHRGAEVSSGVFAYKWHDSLLSCDYSNTHFDWSSLRNRYVSEPYTQDEADAVAGLMLACGIGTETNFGKQSGSDISRVKRLLIENLGYSPEIYIRYKNNYSISEWGDTLYNELSQGRPVFCQGGGHAFICDGYEGNNYFHFNWGWDGICDGNFLPSLLNPTETDRFHEDEYILTGVQTNIIGLSYRTPDLICKDDFRVEPSGQVTMTVWNYSSHAFNGSIGFKITTAKGGDATYKEIYRPFKLEFSELIGAWMLRHAFHETIDLPKHFGLNAGIYKLYPAYRGEDNIWRNLRCFTGCQDHILLEVTEDNEYIYSNPPLRNEANYNIKVADVIINEDTEYAGTVYANEWFNVSLTYSNLSDVICRPNIFLHFYSNDEICAIFETSIILEGQIDYQFSFGVTQTFDVGDYELDFYDEYGRRLNDETVCFSVIPRPDGSGIEAPEADGWDADAPVEYYDLQGRKVANPTTGFYIARQGALTRKVFIR